MKYYLHNTYMSHPMIDNLYVKTSDPHNPNSNNTQHQLSIDDQILSTINKLVVDNW
jgi:hypothetical protein